MRNKKTLRVLKKLAKSQCQEESEFKSKFRRIKKFYNQLSARDKCAMKNEINHAFVGSLNKSNEI